MCGVVDGGIVAGECGYEAGQSGVGDIFAWFLDHAVPADYRDEAERRGVSLFDLLSAEAAAQPAGAHGLIALDWLNGNRSVLVDVQLSGAIVGLTLATRPPDIYRALVEATAFGTRVIIDAFSSSGCGVSEFVVAGGLLKDSFVMQVYADVLRRPLSVISSDQGPALGSAIHAAVAAGAYPDVPAAAAAMGGKRDAVYTPDPASADVYDDLYAEYVRAARLLRPGRQRGHAPAAGPARPGARRRDRRRRTGRTRPSGDPEPGGQPAMTTDHASYSAITRARQEVCALHGSLVDNGLVAWTSGNISARVAGAGPDGTDLMVIKPSGVAYADLTPESMVVCDLDGNAVDRTASARPATPRRTPTSTGTCPRWAGWCTPTRTYATAWAARGEADPVRDHGDGRRVRRRDPARAVRADRQRRDRPRHRGHPDRAPLPRRADAQPRGVHHRPYRARRGQGRGDVRGRGPHRAPGPGLRRAHAAGPGPGGRAAPAVLRRNMASGREGM